MGASYCCGHIIYEVVNVWGVLYTVRHVRLHKVNQRSPVSMVPLAVAFLDC